MDMQEICDWMLAKSNSNVNAIATRILFLNVND